MIERAVDDDESRELQFQLQNELRKELEKQRYDQSITSCDYRIIKCGMYV